MAFRILHVDDDEAVLEIVRYILDRESDLAVMSFADAEAALSVAADLRPDLILCDAMMPGIDGAAVLGRLRSRAETAKVPVVFMTARARDDELARFNALGVAGIIVKPFDPLSLAALVRGYLPAARRSGIRNDFFRRLRADKDALGTFRDSLRCDPDSPSALADLQSLAHKLAGVSGILGYKEMASAAAALEDTVLVRRVGKEVAPSIEACLAALIDCIRRTLECECAVA